MKNHLKGLVLAGGAFIALGFLFQNAPAALAADNTATLKVITNVVNNNGGTNQAGDFTIHIIGASSTPGTFPGNSLGQNVEVTAGIAYSASISTMTYTIKYSPDCAGILTAGGTSTCTITADDIAQLPSGQNPPNLIQNPSLEVTNGALPENWFQGSFGTNVSAFSYPVSGLGGGKAVKVSISSSSSTNPGDAKWFFAEVPIIGGHQYNFSDSYLSDVPSELTAVFYDATHTVIGFGGFVSVPVATTTLGGDEWPIAKTTFTAPQNATYMTVYHLISTVGSLTTDNYSLTEALLPTPLSKGIVSLTFDDGFTSQFENAKPKLEAGNVRGTFYLISHVLPTFSIPNGSLEIDATSDGVPDGWSFSGNGNSQPFYPVEGHTGKAAEVRASSTGSNATWSFTPTTIMDDHIYSFSEYYRSNAVSSLIAQVVMSDGSLVMVDATDAAGNATENTISLPSTNNSWTQVQTYYYVPVGAKSITILNRLQGSGTLAIDDLELGVEGYMSAAQVLDLQTSGHEIGGHSQTHSDLTSLSPEEATAEISGSKQDLINGGVSLVKAFNYPYGSYNTNVQQITLNAGYTSGRTVLPGFNGKNTPKFALFSQSVNSDTPLAQVQGWIDQAKSDRSWLILTFHDILPDLTGLPYGTTPTNLEAIISYINANQVPVYTVSSGLGLMNNPTLNVSTNVINLHGGTSTPDKFTIAVTGNQATPNSFTGSTTPTSVDLAAGSYSVDAINLPNNYTKSLSSECTGNIIDGEIKNCTISFSDIATTTATSTDTILITIENILPNSLFITGTTSIPQTPVDVIINQKHYQATSSNSGLWQITRDQLPDGLYNVIAQAADHSASTTADLIVDGTAPIITLIGSSTLSYNIGGAYQEFGATTTDNVDLAVPVTISSSTLNMMATGTYAVTYNAVDRAGNHATQITRTIIVKNLSIPVIHLIGNATTTLTAGQTFIDPGVTASDTVDGDITNKVIVTGDTIGTSTPAGTYRVIYNVTNSSGAHADQVIRTVIISPAVAQQLLISEQHSIVDNNKIVISWKTNQPASSRLLYDTVSHPNPVASTTFSHGYANSTAAENTLTTEHSITLNNLNPGTTYYLRPISKVSLEVFGQEMTVTTPNTSYSSGGGGGAYIILHSASEPPKRNYSSTSDEEKEDGKVLGTKIYGSINDSQIRTLFGLDTETVETMSRSEAESISTSSLVTTTGKTLELYNKIVSGYGQTIDINMADALKYFIQLGTKTTQRLGMGERAGVLESYKNAFNKLPQSISDWQDVIKIANGRWPKTKITMAEKSTEEKYFKTIYNRSRSNGSKQDEAVISIITYGLRPAARNLESEAFSIKAFGQIFKHKPLTSTDWNIVRAIAYSGSRRN